MGQLIPQATDEHGPIMRRPHFDPHRVGHRLGRELEGCYSARVGDYRFISWIDKDERVVYVDRVDHGTAIQRPRSVDLGWPSWCGGSPRAQTNVIDRGNQTTGQPPSRVELRWPGSDLGREAEKSLGRYRFARTHLVPRPTPLGLTILPSFNPRSTRRIV